MNDYKKHADAREAARARLAAKTLNDAGCDAVAAELDGAWYVVVNGASECDLDTVYDVADIRIEDVTRDGWNPAELSELDPIVDRNVAAAYYLLNDGALLYGPLFGQPVLSDDDRELLDLARRVLA